MDGSFDVSDLEKEYDLIASHIPELSSEEMRKVISGNARAKHAALWEGPFDSYVWLDSDAIVWGDFYPAGPHRRRLQIFWSDISIPADATEIPPWLLHFYFDPVMLQQFDPELDWRGKAYFSACAFVCKREASSFEKWMEVESWGRQSRGLFC